MSQDPSLRLLLKRKKLLDNSNCSPQHDTTSDDSSCSDSDQEEVKKRFKSDVTETYSVSPGASSSAVATVQSQEVVTNSPSSSGNNSSQTATVSLSSQTPTNDQLDEEAVDKRNDQSPVHFNFESHSLKDRFAAVFNKPDFSDVTFVVGSEQLQKFPAHKVVLGVSSPVFNAMLNGPLANNDKQISIPDVDPRAFKILLRFIYTDDILLDQDVIMETLYVAKKYNVLALEQNCVSFLKLNLTGDNVFVILNQARLFDQAELEKACLRKIDKSTKEVLESEGFIELDHETLCWLLERDTLSVKEVEVFEAAIRWAKHQCSKKNLQATTTHLREVLGNALTLVRFPTMQPKEFAEIVDVGILTDKEVITIFKFLASELRPAIGFPCKPRNPYAINNKLVLRRFDGLSDPQPAIGSQEIKFLVDKPILLGGVGLFTAKYGPYKYQVYVDVKDCDSDTILTSHRSIVNCNGTPSTYKLWFKKPVKIKPQVVYEVAFISTNPRNYCGIRGKSSITLKVDESEEVTFQFFNSNDGKAYCSAHDGGQIPEFLFYI